MVMATFQPDREFTYDELDNISGKLPGKWTWPTASMLWMIEQGLEIKLIEEFDYKAFVDRGGDYLIERFGEEVGRAQIAMSDIEREREIARRFVKRVPIEYRVPLVDDLLIEIKRGAVVVVNLNAAALHGHRGYSGHFVVICDVREDLIRLHDPGLPPNPNLDVSINRFNCAWGYPTERDKNLLAVNLKPGSRVLGLKS